MVFARPHAPGVSTHSRPKAAGFNITVFYRERKFQHTAARRRLVLTVFGCLHFVMFQHTAARRRLEKHAFYCRKVVNVSTHSRPKAAGGRNSGQCPQPKVSTHSRPKAAGIQEGAAVIAPPVSTHSRPKAAG